MAALTLPVILGLLMVSLSASLIVIWVIGFAKRRPSKPLVAPVSSTSTSTFLFEDDTLVDHDVTPEPQTQLNIDMLSDWSDLRAWLGLRFRHLPETLSDYENGDHAFDDVIDPQSGLRLSLVRNGKTTHARLHNEISISPANWHFTHLSNHLSTDAKEVLDHTPFPIWKTDQQGEVIWRNTVCADIVTRLGKMPEMVEPPNDKEAHTRFSVPCKDGQETCWFEVTCHELDQSQTLHVATAIDQVIHAESAQRAFVQTLTKTFANLTTGLAVFDKNHQLALFNPALVDLTGISVSFLSARPDVIRFFDELRERKVLPEPKNYATLRGKIRDVIAQAHDGNYFEIWNLPGGVTYRVTGRPHPDGAVAFLIEDISAEILKTRQFRTQIELGQSVIDALKEAVVVVAQNDTILFCNAACTDLLKFDPGISFSDLTVDDLLSACRDQFQSNSLWAIFESSVRNDGGHLDDTSRFLNNRSGDRMRYQIKGLAGGVRMITFSDTERTTQKITTTAAE